MRGPGLDLIGAVVFDWLSLHTAYQSRDLMLGGSVSILSKKDVLVYLN